MKSPPRKYRPKVKPLESPFQSAERAFHQDTLWNTGEFFRVFDLYKTTNSHGLAVRSK